MEVYAAVGDFEINRKEIGRHSRGHFPWRSCRPGSYVRNRRSGGVQPDHRYERGSLIGADNLMWTLAKVDYRTTEDVKKMLSVFHGPQCTFESAIEVLAETAKRLWLENPLYHQKIDLLDAILDALGTNRPTKQVAQHFTIAIKLKLFLVPNTADAIAERVRLWKETKLGRVGIIVPGRYRAE